MAHSAIFSSRMKIADIITDPAVLSVIERLDINFGFGEATIDEICKQYGLSTDLFLMICKVYSSDTFVPGTENLEKSDIPKIIGYLQRTHKYWLDNCLPHLHTNIHAMLENCEDTSKRILNKFYDDYDEEIHRHLEYEENTVFPYVLSLVKEPHSEDKKFRISNFEENHSDIDEKLLDLKNIVLKYLPENENRQARIDVLNDIFKIGDDIRRHSLIENKILIPLVSKFEIR